MAWNIPTRRDTERAAAQFLASPALAKIKIEDEWFDRAQIIDKLNEWSGYPMTGPSPEYRELLDASDVREI